MKDDSQQSLSFGRPIQEGRAGGMHGALVRYDGCTRDVSVKSWWKETTWGKTEVNSRTLNGYYLNHIKCEGIEWINLN